MKQNDNDKQLIFFAYQGRRNGQSDENVEAIQKAIEIINQHQKQYIAKSWESYKETRVISKKILNEIDKCAIFICDVTYFNHNVLFELGYAIAKNKKILVLLNENLDGIKTTYQKSIYRDISYVPFLNGPSIATAVQDKRYNTLLKDFVNVENIDCDSNDIFYIQNKLETQASLDLLTMFDKYQQERECTIIKTNRSEVAYKPLSSYFQSIFKSRCIVIHFLGKNIENEFIENGNNSFLAGAASGFEKKVCLVAPAVYHPPLDYHEILFPYETSAQLVNHTKEWLAALIAPSHKKQTIAEHEINLIKLGIGDDVAENEGSQLLNYFVETAAYNTALKSSKSIIVGRKGSGKSAIYIKLVDELSKINENYVISLRPEPDELEEHLELSARYNITSRTSFFFTVWKLTIFSKLINVICEKMMQRSQSAYTLEEEAIFQFVESNENLINLNFLGFIKEINSRADKLIDKDSPAILENLYKEYLGPLIRIIKMYFSSTNKKYCKLIIVADNLDKTWNRKHNLDVQSEMILTLLDIGSKLKNELADPKLEIREIRNIVFLRKDIFDYIRRSGLGESDKLLTMSHEIDWDAYPNLLKKLIDNRFKYILQRENSDDVSMEKIWAEYFDFKGTKHPFETILEITAKRPRDIIYFITRLFESAINSGHNKANDDDLERAIEEYSDYLNERLIEEAIAEYPKIREILSKLQTHHGQTLEYKEFVGILEPFSFTQVDIDQLISTLFEKEYLIGYEEKERTIFNKYDELSKKLNQKRYYFWRPKIYLIPHAMYWLIKNKRLYKRGK